jgi:ketosteroid isomerase-like protein
MPGIRYLLFATLLSACVFTAKAETHAAARQAIAALRENWAKDLHDKRIEPAMDLYADKAVFYSPGADRADGKPRIRELFLKVTKTYDSDIQLHSLETGLSGPLAYDSGDYEETLTVRSSGAVNHVRGSYLMVLRRGADGRWRIQQHMWTFVAPEAPAP